MDRLDTWLNAQRGWRFLLARCVFFAPLGLAAGSVWTHAVTVDPATPQVRALFARMALCVGASFLLAALTMLSPDWRRPARRTGRTVPAWRLIAGLYSFCGSFVVSAYRDAEPLAWRQHNGWAFLVQPALIGVFVAMLAWRGDYLRRLRRRRDHGVSG